jgi:hypothetical protein
VKWLLAIPHYIVLAFLWLALLRADDRRVLRDPLHGALSRGIFDFNLGVLRWTWRVASTRTRRSARIATRRSRSTMSPTIPRRLDVPYQERLSRGLVLVKWWLLAIPQYIPAIGNLR